MDYVAYLCASGRGVAALRRRARGLSHCLFRPPDSHPAYHPAFPSLPSKREKLGWLNCDDYRCQKVVGVRGRERGTPLPRHALRPPALGLEPLVADGLTNAQISHKLSLSESTVKQHLHAAYRLLGVKNRTEAASLFRNGGR